MKKKVSAIMVSVFVVGALAGCSSASNTDSKPTSTTASSTTSSAESSTSSSSSQESIEIKLAHGAAETVAVGQGATKFSELAKEYSNGKLNVQVYPNQQLGGDREYTEAVQMGNVQIGLPSCTPVANFEPTLYIFDTPFAFSSRENAFEILDSEVGQEIMGSLSNVGIKGVGCWENGFRNLTGNGEPVTSPEQLKGVKIRTMENDIHMEMWRAFGANPTPMAFGELYTALQQKTVDAQENPLQLIYETKYHEVQDYCTETRHIYTPYLFLVNEEFFNSLSAEDQDAFMKAYQDATTYQREQAATGEEDARKKIAEHIDVVQLTDEQRQEFVDRTSHIRDMVKEKCGNAELCEKFFEAIDNQ